MTNKQGRKEKIQLLKEMLAGEKHINAVLPEVNIFWFIHKGIYTYMGPHPALRGKEFTKEQVDQMKGDVTNLIFKEAGENNSHE